MTTPYIALDDDDLIGRQIDNSTTEAEWSPLTQICLEVTMVIAWILAFFGNLLVIAVVFKHEGMRTRTNFFIANLAIADFLVSVFNMPFSFVTVIARDWIFGDVMCQINGFAMLFFFCVSVHTLMYISVHKYVTITHPFSERHKMTYAKVGVMIAATYVISGILCVLTNFVLNHVLYKRNTSQCGPAYPHDPSSYIHSAIVSAFTYIIPLFIMIVAYIRIFIEIRAYSKRLTVHSNMDRDCILTRQKRATVTLVIVMVVFLLCWTPYFFYANYSTALVSRGKKVPPYMNPICYWLGYINSACNPIIYGLRSPSFREGYKRIFCFGEKNVITTDASTSRRDSLMALLRRLSKDSAVAGENSVMNRLSVIVQGIQNITKKDTAIANHIIGGAERYRRNGTCNSPTCSSPNKASQDLPIVYTKHGKIVKIEHRKISRSVITEKRRNSDSDVITGPIEGSTNCETKGFSYPDLMFEHEDGNVAMNENTNENSRESLQSTVVTIETGVVQTTVANSNAKTFDDHDRSLENRKKCHRSISETRYDHNSKKSSQIVVNCLDTSDKADRWWRSSAAEFAEICCDIDSNTIGSFPSLEHLDQIKLVKSKSDSFLEEKSRKMSSELPSSGNKRSSKVMKCLHETDS